MGGTTGGYGGQQPYGGTTGSYGNKSVSVPGASYTPYGGSYGAPVSQSYQPSGSFSPYGGSGQMAGGYGRGYSTMPAPMGGGIPQQYAGLGYDPTAAIARMQATRAPQQSMYGGGYTGYGPPGITGGYGGGMGYGQQRMAPSFNPFARSAFGSGNPNAGMYNNPNWQNPGTATWAGDTGVASTEGQMANAPTKAPTDQFAWMRGGY